MKTILGCHHGHESPTTCPFCKANDRAQQQYASSEKELRDMLKTIIKGFVYDPGHSDLDDEQPIVIRAKLGDYRNAIRLLGK